MSDRTAIEWADDSWNPIRARNTQTDAIGHFCVKVSPGCKHCYAERLQTWPIASRIRYAAQELPNVEPFLDEKVLERPLHRKRGRDIFPCSMTDLFADFHPDDWLARIFDVMHRTPQHRYLVLTKRAERMRDFIVGKHGTGNNAFAFGNVWFGFSAENQAAWDARAPHVDDMRALGFHTWASCEPLLGPIDIGSHRLGGIIAGGETGPRPSHPDWFRSLRDQCAAAGMAFFFKQWGFWYPEGTLAEVQARGPDKRTMFFPGLDYAFSRWSKKSTGRELDGRTHDELPR